MHHIYELKITTKILPLPASLVLPFHLISADWLGHWGGVFGQDRLLFLEISAVTDDTCKVNYLMHLPHLYEWETYILLLLSYWKVEIRRVMNGKNTLFGW